eukprot:1472878-Amphidinium_carterae.1
MQNGSRCQSAWRMWKIAADRSLGGAFIYKHRLGVRYSRGAGCRQGLLRSQNPASPEQGWHRCYCTLGTTAMFKSSVIQSEQIP